MKRKAASDLFPEYYVLRVNDFDKVATTPLDEWIEFLKTGNISAKAKAAGLPEARERLRVDALSDKDKQAYYRHMESVRHMKSLLIQVVMKAMRKVWTRVLPKALPRVVPNEPRRLPNS